MSANPRSDGLYMTKAEYLEFERNSDTKHEYINGEVFAMAGAKPNHNRLTMKLSRLIDTHLDGKDCEAFNGDQRLEIEPLDSYVYPDITVTCGESKFTEDPLPALLNPLLIVEVLSPSTERFDRDEKFILYRQIETFREYVLVFQDSARIVCYYLNANNIWEFRDALGLESTITLKSIDSTLSLADIYANVVFDTDTP